MKKIKLFDLRGMLTLFLSLIAFSISAQTVTVSGNIKDDTGFEVIGATVIVEGDATRGTVTDIDGNYTLANVPSNGALQISYVGMRTQVISVDGRTTIDILLTSDTELLDEVVVVGFGTQKKENLTGAVSAVSSDELTARPVNNVVEALQGVVPGMNISTGISGGALNSTQQFNIRGVGTIGTGLVFRHWYLLMAWKVI